MRSLDNKSPNVSPFATSKDCNCSMLDIPLLLFCELETEFFGKILVLISFPYRNQDKSKWKSKQNSVSITGEALSTSYQPTQSFSRLALNLTQLPGRPVNNAITTSASKTALGQTSQSSNYPSMVFH